MIFSALSLAACAASDGIPFGSIITFVFGGNEQLLEYNDPVSSAMVAN